MSGYHYFVIVGHDDNPLFEMKPSNEWGGGGEDDLLSQFLTHSALDLIDEYKWKTQGTFLKHVDRLNEWSVSAFVTASLLRFVMVHDKSDEENVRYFFAEVYELYVKYSMNPFYVINTPLDSLAFRKKVHLSLKKYLS